VYPAVRCQPALDDESPSAVQQVYLYNPSHALSLFDPVIKTLGTKPSRTNNPPPPSSPDHTRLDINTQRAKLATEAPPRPFSLGKVGRLKSARCGLASAGRDIPIHNLYTKLYSGIALHTPCPARMHAACMTVQRCSR
jgi:hypothetical protein